MSRLIDAHPAIRPAAAGRVLISGPPGSGRTETALVVATMLGDGPVLLIDTDYPSSLDLADRFDFEVLGWSEPHDPAEVAATLVEAGDEFAAVIIDTITTQWTGKGGTLETGHGGNWDGARAAQRQLLAAVRSSTAHVVVTCDTDVVYQVAEDGHVDRVGTTPRHDSDIESRYQVALTLDSAHVLTLVNSPGPSLPLGSRWDPGDASDFAIAYRDWLASGELPAPADEVERIRQRIAALPDRADRDAVKNEIRRRLTGQRLDHLRAGQVPAADEMVARYEPVPAYGPERPVCDWEGCELDPLDGHVHPGHPDFTPPTEGDEAP